MVLPNGSGFDDKLKTISETLYISAISDRAPQKVRCSERFFFLISF